MRPHKSGRFCQVESVPLQITFAVVKLSGKASLPPNRVILELSGRTISFTRPWLHFLEVSHSSGRGFPARFRRGARFFRRRLEKSAGTKPG
jgi:hypothetical protein